MQSTPTWDATAVNDPFRASSPPSHCAWNDDCLGPNIDTAATSLNPFTMLPLYHLAWCGGRSAIWHLG